MKKLFFKLFILIHFITIQSLAQQALHPWEVFEFRLESAKTSENPYLDYLKPGDEAYLKAEFTHQLSGEVIIVPGFWDGEKNWKIRFAPSKEGTWLYKTLSPDKKLNNRKGKVLVTAWPHEDLAANRCRHGFIFVNQHAPRNGRYFVHADQTPFLWVGDTWWNWTKKEIPVERFMELIDDRSEKGFTVGQLFFAGNGWGSSASLIDEKFENPDIRHMNAIEEIISYANSKGIVIWIHPVWSRNEMANSIPEEKLTRWWRYVVHRLSAYNVIWVLAGEFNMHNYGGYGLDYWNNLGQIIKNEDPYKRIVSAHPTPPGWAGGADAPQWSTAEVIHNEFWLDYNQSQPGHGKWRNELIPEIVSFAYEQSPPKPIVVTEPWYEFIEGSPEAIDIRFGIWSAIMSGAAGHSYGGGHIWRGHIPESPGSSGTWPLDTSFVTNTLDYPGALGMSFMSSILGNMDWWKLEPHPEVILENPSHYCIADPGNEYLAYIRYGGTVVLNLTGFNHTFNYHWYNLQDHEVKKSGTLKGGGEISISPPEDYPGSLHYKDWLLHIVSD